MASGNPGNFLPPKRDNYVEIESKINVFPTLAKDFVEISVTPDINILSISLYDLAGKNIKTFDAKSNALDISDIQNGAYIVHIKYNENQIYSTKIIINH